MKFIKTAGNSHATLKYLGVFVSVFAWMKENVVVNTRH